MLVKEVMSDRVIRVSPDCNLKEIAIAMRDADLGSIPVSEDDQLIGMVTDRDIVIRGLTGTVALHTMTARDVMSPSVKYCFEDQ
jgi:predicted transcriptional regulator